MLSLNRLINAFQIDYEGKKTTILLDPEFNEKWAAILEAQSKQTNGRRMFMTLYFHPVMCMLRVCKWLPKRNICETDQTFLVQAADDLRYQNEVFLIEQGQFQGYYKRAGDLTIPESKTIKMDITANDSGLCVNCSTQSVSMSAASEPEFVEITDFTDSESEYQNIMEKKQKEKQAATSSQTGSVDNAMESLSLSDIPNDTLEKRKLK